MSGIGYEHLRACMTMGDKWLLSQTESVWKIARLKVQFEPALSISHAQFKEEVI